MSIDVLAADERGEELGIEASGWWERYNSNLSGAIVTDMLQDTEAVIIPV